MLRMKRGTLAAAVAAACLVWLLMPGISQAAPGDWTWMSGSDTTQQIGVYGTKGVPAASNVPGARETSVTWTDDSGDLWLFGGSGYCRWATIPGLMNDLWRYSQDTNMWTWVSGTYSLNRGGVYGTKGVPAASNVPGARFNSFSWTDNDGNFWLFGGRGYDSTTTIGDLNDLWRYDPGTNMWTWVSGSKVFEQPGVYGTQGTPDTDNVPGARVKSISWIDNAGNLWLFGGYGYDNTTTIGWLNDLWCYDPDTNMWTWVSGSNTINQAGTYGTKGTADAANVPGARDLSVSWTDSAGNLWLFGGRGYDNAGGSSLNDLWCYDPDTNMWTWVSGSNTINQAGTYGTKGTADAANVPGARGNSISWIDNAGNFWLLGGHGYVTTTSKGRLNDLWRYESCYQ